MMNSSAVIRIAVSVLILALSLAAVAQEKTLPRVLILGDQVYQQPASEMNKQLKGRVEVVYARVEPGEIRNSFTLINNLSEILGDKKWDVIHFNCGLGDLIYRAPGMQSFRVMARQAGGIRATKPDAYESNLRKLVDMLKPSGAHLIWASTTPIRHSSSNVFEKGSEIQYNQIAEKVMREKGVEINDMYKVVKGLINMDKPASHGADPFFFDRKPIHPPIVAAVCKNLGLSIDQNSNVKK